MLRKTYQGSWGSLTLMEEAIKSKQLDWMKALFDGGITIKDICADNYKLLKMSSLFLPFYLSKGLTFAEFKKSNPDYSSDDVAQASYYWL